MAIRACRLRPRGPAQLVSRATLAKRPRKPTRTTHRLALPLLSRRPSWRPWPTSQLPNPRPSSRLTLPARQATPFGTGRLLGQRLRAGASKVDHPIDEEADRSHRHFVDTPKRLRHVLQPRMNQDATEVFTRVSAPVVLEEDKMNRFDSLHVFEPSEAFLNASGVHTPRTLLKNVQVDSWRNDFHEALFLWETCNSTLHRLRQSIISLWKRYRAGDLGLAGVSTAHNISSRCQESGA